MSTTAPTRYSMPQIAIHWLVVLLVIFNWLTGEPMAKLFDQRLETGAPPYLTPHAVAGALVLALLLARLVLRRTHGAPAPVVAPVWMMTAARLGHAALYLLLALVPASGAAAWFLASETAGEAHKVLFTLLLVVALIHAAAAIWHQLVLKDGTLTRMSLRR
ncbi:cytochrome b [Paracoccus jiaweipingae]|uniref:cytochrome b n=1 Tax=unclassified Paracoccus (in: a-proteobacteria) TaxID=2688777 RepID=UPI0037958A91